MSHAAQFLSLDPCAQAAEREAILRLAGALQGLEQALTAAHSRTSTQRGLAIIGELSFIAKDAEAELSLWHTGISQNKD